MKKKILVVFLLACGSYNSFAQEKSQLILVRTEPNGVQVYESVGNEGKAENIQVNTPVRSMNDWNLEECENALYFIRLKISSMKENEGNELFIQDYEAQIVQINEKIKSL